MRYLVFLISLAMLVGCQNMQKPADKAHVATKNDSHDHEGHEDHDHASHIDHDKSHEGHEGHDHEGHDHEGHEDHDHASHIDHDKSHEGHEGHDHEVHDHGVVGDYEGQNEELHNPDEIVFPVSQQQATDFQVARAAKGAFRDVIRGWGEILPAQGAEQQIVAPSSGVVTYWVESIVQGVGVRQGQKLFEISSKNVATGDLLERNRTNYNRAKSDYQRAKELIGERIISQAEYSQVEQLYKQAKIEYDALGGDGAQGAVAVVSPIAGQITALNFTAGEYVEMGQVLGSVSQDKSLILRVEAPLKYHSRLKDVVAANFTTTYDNKTHTLAQPNAKLLSIGRIAEQGGVFVPVIFQFNNDGQIISGVFVETLLLGKERNDVISLPVGAVTEQQGIYYIYIQEAAEVFMKREVRLGGNDGVRVEIVSGLSEGERVVTKGAVSVKMASFSGAIPHSHEH